MGNFYVTFTIKTVDVAAVRTALAGRHAVLVPDNGYVVFADEEADGQDEEIIAALGRHVSKELATSVLCVLNHDDDILMYWACERGKVVDSYNSAPDYWNDTTEPSGPVGGQASVLARLFGATDTAELEKVFRADWDAYAFAMDRHARIIELLSLPLASLGISYSVAKEGDLADHIDQQSIVFT